MMDSTAVLSGDLPLGELCRRLQQKCEYARIIDDLSSQQQELIDAGDYSGLVQLLARKQTAVEYLQNASQVDPPLVEQWKQKRDQLPQELRIQCERWLSATETYLQETRSRDEKCTAEMQQRRDQTETQLAAISAAIHTQDAYRDPVESRHFDMNR